MMILYLTEDLSLKLMLTCLIGKFQYTAPLMFCSCLENLKSYTLMCFLRHLHFYIKNWFTQIRVLVSSMIFRSMYSHSNLCSYLYFMCLGRSCWVFLVLVRILTILTLFSISLFYEFLLFQNRQTFWEQ